MIWESMGFTRWPMLLCFFFLLILSLLSALKLFRPGASAGLRTKAWIDGVVVWGFLAFLTGLLGAVVGIITIFQSIESAGAIRGPIVAPGAKSTLLSSGTGTMILIVAVFLWYILQLRWRLLQAAEAEAKT